MTRFENSPVWSAGRWPPSRSRGRSPSNSGGACARRSPSLRAGFFCRPCCPPRVWGPPSARPAPCTRGPRRWCRPARLRWDRPQTRSSRSNCPAGVKGHRGMKGVKPVVETWLYCKTAKKIFWDLIFWDFKIFTNILGLENI